MTSSSTSQAKVLSWGRSLTKRVTAVTSSSLSAEKEFSWGRSLTNRVAAVTSSSTSLVKVLAWGKSPINRVAAVASSSIDPVKVFSLRISSSRKIFSFSRFSSEVCSITCFLSVVVLEAVSVTSPILSLEENTEEFGCSSGSGSITVSCTGSFSPTRSISFSIARESSDCFSKINLHFAPKVIISPSTKSTESVTLLLFTLVPKRLRFSSFTCNPLEWRMHCFPDISSNKIRIVADRDLPSRFLPDCNS